MRHKGILLGLIGVWLFGSSVAWAQKHRPYDDPQRGYNIKEDERPWFDGQDFPFFRDMYDGKSIKPQEEGSYTKFPQDSVPVRFILGKITPIYDPFVPVEERASRPQNSTEATPESVENGRQMYMTYCAVCHGKDGKAETLITAKGVPAPAIEGMLSALPESYLYNKVRYGSFYQEPRGRMPAYGGQTSQKDRWDIVNYLKSPQFGK